MNRNVFGLALLAAGSAVDSSSGVLTRMTTADGFTIASARGFLAFVLLFTVLMIRDRGRIGPALATFGPWGLVFMVINPAGMVLTLLSLKYTAVANFFMIFATAPFVAGLMGWAVLREKLDLATGLAAAFGFLGILIMVSGSLTGVNLGDVLAMVVVLAYGVNVMILRKAPQIDVLALLTMTVLVSGVMSWPFATFDGLTSRDWGVLATLGFFQLGLGNILIFAAVSRVTAAEAGLLGIMGAVFAPTWVFAVLGEVPPERTLWGGAVILAAGLAHFLWSMTRPRAAEPQV